MIPAEQIPFELEKAEDHSQEMILDLLGLSDGLTDLNAGGIARTLIEAVAIQLEKLDSKMFFGVERAIPSILYTALNFPKLAAVKSSGLVTFTRQAGFVTDITIPAGTVLNAPATTQKPQVSFATATAKTLLGAQASITVPVAAVVAGKSGNVSAGRISVLSVPIAGIDTVSNAAAIKNGADEESEEERQVRFRKFVINLARSPIAGIEAGAAMAQILDVNGDVVERVAKALAIEPANTLGLVRVYIDNGGGTASADLITAAQTIVDGSVDANGTRVPGYKAAGVVVEVLAIESVAVPVTAKIKLNAGYDFAAVQADCQDVIEDFFLNLGPGDALIYADLISAIVNTPGVYDVQIYAPTANLNADSSQRLLAGTVTITEMA